MQAAIDRVHAGVHVDGEPHPRRGASHTRKTGEHLAGMDADEKALAVEGLRYLRGPGRVARRRMAREAT